MEFLERLGLGIMVSLAVTALVSFEGIPYVFLAWCGLFLVNGFEVGPCV